MITHVERRRLSRRLAEPYFTHLAPNQLIELRNLVIAMILILFLGWLLQI